MKDNILSINLGTEIAPVVAEQHGRDWITYGTENWANLYPQFLIDLYYNSSTQAAIINATSEMISGENLVIEDEEDRSEEAVIKMKHFMDRANHNESLHEVIKKIAFDFKLQGAFALNIVWSKDRTQIAEIYHIPVEKIRAARPNAMGRVEAYYISTDWGNTRKHKPQRVDAFSMTNRTQANQILYSGLYSPNMNVYHTPDYTAANNWALIDQRVAEFHLNNINNSFSGSYMFAFNNGVPTQEERLQIERSLQEKFTSASNAGKFILSFSDDRNRSPEVTPLNTADLDKQYLALQELLVQNILTGHRVTSPMLMGIKNDTGLGSNVDELNAAGNFYLNTVVKPYQDHIVKVLRKIFKVNQIDMPVNFVQLKPITLEFTSEDLKGVMTESEIREELGLEPLDIEVREDFAKVGSMITDGVELPLFETKEEAEKEAEKMGCKGSHEHTQDGKTYFMPCENHEQITNLNNCNCKEEFITPNPCQPGYEAIGMKTKNGRKVPNCVPVKAKKELSEKTELESCIAEFGEDMPKGWVIISEEDAEKEAEDFNFESELNSDYYEFASTGSAYPNRKSGQDQTTKQEKYKDDIYRVRYRYAGSKKGERDFCRKMTNANKIYRKEDIIAMGRRQVNPGWGKGGANTYSIWKWKGGALCKHKWFRIILVQEGNRPKNSDKIISSTEARSRGVSLPRNAKEVSVAPHDMPDHGFVNPELIAKYKNVK